MKNFENKVARVVVVNPDKSILLNRRPAWSKQAPNKLQILGGKFKAEDLTRKHAAKREILEELGLDIAVANFLFVEASENNGWVTFAFLLLLEEEYSPEMMPDHQEFDTLVKVDWEQIEKMIESEEIAFDHPAILRTVLQVLSSKL
ncbi:MAG: NUDIX hydrolase [Patescibacteria group bacterium]